LHGVGIADRIEQARGRKQLAKEKRNREKAATAMNQVLAEEV
jgi:hypothetical protein